MAVRFDATTDALTSAANWLASSTYTVTCWIRFDSVVAGQNIWALDRAEYIPLNIAGGGSGAGKLVVGDNELHNVATSPANGLGELTVTTGTWYRTAVVVTEAGALNGADDLCTFYRSAAGDPLGSASAINFRSITNNKLWIGAARYGWPFLGRVAAFKLWDAALTENEVIAELAQYQPVRTTNLRSLHPFVVTELVDYSGGGNTLTAGSTATATEDGPPIPWRVTERRLILPAVAAGGVTGSLAATLPALTATLDGASTATGVLAGSLPALTADLDGTLTASGTLNAQLPVPTAALTGQLAASGSLAAQLPALTADFGATLTSSGSLGGQLPVLTAALTGDVDVGGASGSVAAALSALVADLDATVTLGGALTTQPPALIADLDGVLTTSGTFAGQLPALTSALTGQLTTGGAFTAQLPTLTADPVGVLTANGNFVTQLPVLTAALTGDVAVAGASGTLTGVLPAFTSGLDGTLTDRGTLAVLLPNLIAVTNGILATAGPFAAVLPALTVSMTNAVLAAWPPVVAGPFTESLFTVAGPVAEPLFAVAAGP